MKMKFKAKYNSTWVTQGKIYQCIEETETRYVFIDDDNGKQQRLKQHCEIIEGDQLNETEIKEL